MRNKLMILLLMATALQAELFTEYFEDHAIKSETEYTEGTRTAKEAGIKNGFEKIYYNSGQIAYTANNVDGLREGALNWYDREGHHLEVIHFQKGKRHGINKIFYDNGTLRTEVNYINDEKEGMEKDYFDSGEIASEVKYISGKKEGMAKEYYVNGKVANNVLYVHNYQEGEKHYYDQAGKIIKTEIYKMDRPVKLMKQVQAKKPDATIEALKGLDFNPKNRKLQ